MSTIRIVRIVVLSNPISGSGRATAAGDELAAVLRNVGHDVLCAHTRLEPPSQWLDQIICDANLLVISGGDGAVRLASDAAARCNVPIYHLPMGTENLFAREFGMDRNPQTFISALNNLNIMPIDLGVVTSPEPAIFTLMASIGFDAEVVHELANTRGKSISHLTYIKPILSQITRWKPCDLRISVDGEPIQPANPNDTFGFALVGNSRQYGWRFDPADRAVMNDGLLDVVCFPTRNVIDVVRLAIKCMRRRQFDDSRFVYRRGRRVAIRSETFCRYQLDGDPAGPRTGEGSQGFRLDIEMKPCALRVLVPPAKE